MRSIKINKVAAIGMMMVTAIGIIWAHGLTVKRPMPHGGSPPMGVITSLDAQISIPFMPKVGEVFDVTLTVQCNKNFEKLRFGPAYTAIFTVSKGVEIIEGKEQKFYGYMRKDEIKQFKAKIMIKEPVSLVSIYGGISAPIWGPQGIGCEMFLIDEITGQYGTKEEYEKQLHQQAEWWYDHAGEFTNDPVTFDCAAENRKIIG
ncbi:hypothetical protein A2Y85_04815 [candidate division WOR-3 bacterium RBG_13_43_14]|uniref:Uncharacterized protein n=1 Tax=candidate division WOR-3 bacterium RBG_13_43_14 TaxID=1802590 RepID=A0A1F4UCB0_UNCW3|nr:MAG: hypothetical protein A2Y85_04815 [candidate division WOR-3 bacterium RBG_13_43_14]